MQSFLHVFLIHCPCVLQKTNNETSFLEFTELKLHEGYDAVYIYGGKDDSAPLLKTFNAYSLVLKLPINHKYLFVTFKTDDRKKPHGMGFKIKY